MNERAKSSRGRAAARVVVFGAFAVGMTVACPARANDAARAQALFEEARALMEKGDAVHACPKLEDSQKLDPGPGTEYNLALCYEMAGKTASAWATFLSVAAAFKATQRPEWETKARERAKALLPKLARVTIQLPDGSRPPGLRVVRDGSEVVASELGTAIPVDPGTHFVEATATGRAKWSVRIDVPQGAEKTVVVTFGAAAEPGTPNEGAGAKPASPPSESQSTLGFVVGGVGVLALGAGAVTGLVAMGKNADSKKDCPEDGICRSRAALDANDAAHTFATISTVTFVAGGALLATGIVLVVTAPRGQPTTGLRVVPSMGVGAHAGGLMLQGAF